MPKEQVKTVKPNVDQVIAEINKAMKKDVVGRASDMAPIHRWPSGVLPFDHLADGGLAAGRFTEIYGPFSSLKSFIALKLVAETQRRGGVAAYVDSEHAFDEPWAIEQGVNVDELLVQRPETGEEALTVMEALIRGGYDLIVWDSIAATQPKQYAEKAPGDDNQPAGLARMMSAGLRRLNTANSKTAVLAINQTRTNIGMTFGSKMSVPGGNAMPFYASVRMNFIKAGRVNEDVMIWTGDKLESAKSTVQHKMKIVVDKSKLSAPHREVWFNYDLRTGQVDELSYMIGWAVEQGIIQIGNAGLYTWDNDWKIRGKDKFFAAIAEETELIEWMRKTMMAEVVSESDSHTSPSKQGKSKAASQKSKS